jgi:hypothetical protein
MIRFVSVGRRAQDQNRPRVMGREERETSKRKDISKSSVNMKEANGRSGTTDVADDDGTF